MRLLVLTFAAAAFAQRPAPPPVDEKLPLPPPQQPLPFSHKTHVSKASLKCQDCHKIEGEGFQAGIPKESFCMGCHVAVRKESPEIQKLAALFKEKKPAPWVRIYKVPDMVWFSHQVHAKEKGFPCDNCHGPVHERDTLFKEKPTNMTSCMACHAVHKASNGCDFCHASQ